MTTIGLVLFFVGLVGLVVISVFLTWELKQGTRAFAQVRTRGDRMAVALYRTLVFGEIPHVYRTSFIAKLRHALHQVVHSLVIILRAIERPLARFSRRMTYSQGAAKQGERTPSPFLKDITRTKNNGKKPENPV